MPLYQYIFEILAKNTHLLPLGVPIKSDSEDFQTTLMYEKCLWGTQDIKVRDVIFFFRMFLIYVYNTVGFNYF